MARSNPSEWGSFLPDQPLVTFGPGERKMTLARNFTFLRASGEDITAPTGFVSDGASIPKWLQPLEGNPWDGRYRRAAIIHDWLCHQGRTTGQPAPAYAHRIFFEAMRASGIPHWRARIKQLVKLFTRWQVR